MGFFAKFEKNNPHKISSSKEINLSDNFNYIVSTSNIDIEYFYTQQKEKKYEINNKYIIKNKEYNDIYENNLDQSTKSKFLDKIKYKLKIDQNNIVDKLLLVTDFFISLFKLLPSHVLLYDTMNIYNNILFTHSWYNKNLIKIMVDYLKNGGIQKKIFGGANIKDFLTIKPPIDFIRFKVMIVVANGNISDYNEILYARPVMISEKNVTINIFYENDEYLSLLVRGHDHLVGYISNKIVNHLNYSSDNNVNIYNQYLDKNHGFLDSIKDNESNEQ